MTAARPALVAVFAAALGACSTRDTVAESGKSVPGHYAPVVYDGSCANARALAARSFPRAVCACGSLSLSGDLVTDSFDSRAGTTRTPAGGDVDVLGGLAFSGLLHVGGNLVVAGGGVEAGQTLRVGGDLAIAGPLGRPSTVATVDGSASIAGDVGVASLTVTGTLTTPPGATVGSVVSAGSTVTAAVTVSSPCPCGATAVDVGGTVAARQAANDDAALGIAADTLSFVSGPTTVDLPSGLVYLDRIQGNGAVTLHATGRAALFVGGGITLSGSLAVTLDPTAELDLFVAGPVNLPATLLLGDPARPRALRIWFAAGGTIGVPAGAVVAGNLYASGADLSIASGVELHGGVTAAHVLDAGALAIHYDRAITAVDVACAP